MNAADNLGLRGDNAFISMSYEDVYSFFSFRPRSTAYFHPFTEEKLLP
jgi:hypothetical protein